MKKQFIAKLLVLAMVLALVPTAAFAKQSSTSTDSDNPYAGMVKVTGKPANGNYFYDCKNSSYYYYIEDTTPSAPATSEAPAASEKPAIPEVLDTVEEIKDDQVEATDEGTTVTIKATVTEGVASVSVTAAAIESLAEQVKGDTLTLNIEAAGATQVAVTLPGAALVAMAEKSGVDVVMQSSVATITIPNDAMTSVLKNADSIAMSAGIDASGKYAIAVMADGKPVTKDIKGLVVKF